MAEVQEDSYNSTNHSFEQSHDKPRIEPIYEAFLCPLSKQIMLDPVTIGSGQTYDREAIVKWFEDCRSAGRKPTCPVTSTELSSTELNPSIALRNAIEEWMQRNESARLDQIRWSLIPGNSEVDVLEALNYVTVICQNNLSGRHVVRKAGLISLISDLLKNGSGMVRCKALESLRILAEDNDSKEDIAAGDTIRTIVKFLSHGSLEEKEKASSLLFELSNSEHLCEKIGGVNGAILILVGLSSSNSENLRIVGNAENTLDNLEKCENNVRQMAENGRLRPLLNLLLEGLPDMQLSMAAYLGEVVLSNDVKVLVAQRAGSALVGLLKSGNKEAREAALKALNQISTYEVSAKILIEAGILPSLVAGLFTIGSNQLPMRLKEMAANILSCIVASGANFESIPVDQNQRTLVSEDIVHNLLHLISNTGPATECKLLQVLVGLTASSTTALSIVAAIKSSGAIISLIQFVEAPQRDVRMASIKLLHNISPYMGQEIADAFHGALSQLSSLVRVIADNNGLSEEQSAAAGLICNLPERDSVLNRRLFEERGFSIVISRVMRIRQGETHGSRYVNPFLEGLIGVLARITYILDSGPDVIAFAREHNLTVLFTDMLQMNGLDRVQFASGNALKNLSEQTKHLTRIPEVPEPPFCGLLSCLSKPQVASGLCRIHHGVCSARESFCLWEGKAVEKLVGCLDHPNEKVVEVALAALCTLLEDDVDIEEGVSVLCETCGIQPILQVLCESRNEILRQQAIWAVERILRIDDIAYEISGNQNVGTALIEAYQHGDYKTRQIAERALKHVDKLPNFSGIFSKMGG